MRLLLLPTHSIPLPLLFALYLLTARCYLLATHLPVALGRGCCQRKTARESQILRFLACPKNRGKPNPQSPSQDRLLALSAGTTQVRVTHKATSSARRGKQTVSSNRQDTPSLDWPPQSPTQKQAARRPIRHHNAEKVLGAPPIQTPLPLAIFFLGVGTSASRRSNRLKLRIFYPASNEEPLQQETHHGFSFFFLSYQEAFSSR